MLTTEFKNDRNHIVVIDGTHIGNVVQMAVGVDAGRWQFVASKAGLAAGYRDGEAANEWGNALPAEL